MKSWFIILLKQLIFRVSSITSDLVYQRKSEVNIHLSERSVWFYPGLRSIGTKRVRPLLEGPRSVTLLPKHYLPEGEAIFRTHFQDIYATVTFA